MLSRRVVRIKVMQLLYAMSRDSELTTKDLVSLYQKGVRQNFDFYVVHLYAFFETAMYAFKDADLRTKKLRRLPEDEAFTPKLADNPLIRSLRAHGTLKDLFEQHRVADKVQEDTIRKFYTEFSKTEDYAQFLANKDSNEEDLLKVLLALYRHIYSNEAFDDDMEDIYYGWEDDKSIIVGAIKKTIKALPATDHFYREYLPDEEVTKDFGEQLLQKVALREKALLEIIEPNLKNWDADRVAVVDMALIKMGMVEFTDFPTIPTKVTLNEYVELSKLYSTDKSKEFVNGILDRILKKFEKENLLQKEGRGLIG